MAETLLTAARFRVERRAFDVPGRGPVHREVVVHPGAVAIVPLLSEIEVVMIRNDRFAVGAKLLELPAGTLEPPESPVECAARELEEEAGYVAGRIEPLCTFYTSPGFTDEKMYVFTATNLTARQQRLEATERIRVEIMTLDDVLAATCDGRIIDAKTMAALHVYHYRHRREA